MRALVCTLLLAGCDYVFHVERVEGDDDGTHDAAPADSAPITCPGPNAQVAVPLIADATLGVIPHGNDAVLDLTGGNNVLLTFDLGGLSISSYTLTLTRAPHAKECDTSMSDVCAVCPQATGDYNIFYSRTDWDEAKATGSTRDGVASWSGPNASGYLDRSMTTYTITFPLDALTYTHTFNAAELLEPWDKTKLGFHIQGAGGQARFFSREGIHCADGDYYAPPTLSVRCSP